MSGSDVTGGVVHVLDDLHVGGAQQLVVTFAREAEQLGVPVTVVSLNGTEDGPVARRLQASGAEVVAVHPGPLGPLGRGLQALRLRRLLRARRPVVVHTHLTYANVVGGVAAALARVPSVAALHNTVTGDDGNSRVMLALETLCLRHACRAVVAVGAVVEKAQRERLRSRRALVVPNAVDVGDPSAAGDVQRAREVIGSRGERLVLLAVGRLVPAKGYDDLVAAFARVRLEVPDAGLAIVGDGPLRDEISAAAEAAGLADAVHLLGQRDDVRLLMEAADVYVAASHWEGLPVTLLEAMSVGAAVVVTDVGDVSSVVVPGTGVLVPAHDPGRLAQEVVSLLDDPARAARLGAAAREQVASRYGSQQWMKRLMDIYLDVA